MSGSVKALVLCAGYGTRLGALTQRVPKPLLPIEGRPLVGHLLAQLGAQGFGEVGMNLHYCPEQFRDALGDGQQYGVRLFYREEASLLGTAGAVRNFADIYAGCDALLVVYGDLLLDHDLRALCKDHFENNADVTLMLHERTQSNSVVAINEKRRVTRFLERPSPEERAQLDSQWVNSGCQVLGPRALQLIADDASITDLPRHLYVPHCEQLAIFGHPLTGYRCAVDSPERLAQATQAVRDGSYQTVNLTNMKSELR